MTEQEFKEAETISLEMLDWLWAKSSTNATMLTAMIKTTALLLNYSKPAHVTSAKQHEAFLAAIKHELKASAAYAKKNPMPRRKQ